MARLLIFRALPAACLACASASALPAASSVERLRLALTARSAEVENEHMLLREGFGRLRAMAAEAKLLEVARQRAESSSEKLEAHVVAEAADTDRLKKAAEEATALVSDLEGKKKEEERKVALDEPLADLLGKEVKVAVERSGFGEESSEEIAGVVRGVVGGVSLGVTEFEEVVEKKGVPRAFAALLTLIMWILPVVVATELSMRAVTRRNILPYVFAAYGFNVMMFATATGVLALGGGDVFAGLGSGGLSVCMVFAWITQVVFLSVVISYALFTSARAKKIPDLKIVLHTVLFLTCVFHLFRVAIPGMRRAAEDATIHNSKMYLLHLLTNGILAWGVASGDFASVYPGWHFKVDVQVIVKNFLIEGSLVEKVAAILKPLHGIRSIAKSGLEKMLSVIPALGTKAGSKSYVRTSETSPRRFKVVS